MKTMMSAMSPMKKKGDDKKKMPKMDGKMKGK